MTLNLLVIVLSYLSMVRCPGTPQGPVRSFSNRLCYYYFHNNTGYRISDNSRNKTNDSVPTYQTYKRWTQIPLMRVIAGSGVNAYNYYTGLTNYNNSLHDFRKGVSSQNFKSPLLQVWNDLRPSMMNVSLLDVNNKVLAWLAFRVNKGDGLQSWFSKGGLVASFPWKTANIVKQNYKYFSMKGQKTWLVWRSFYIRFSNISHCENDQGVMVIYETLDPCPYVTSKLFPIITFAEKDSGPAQFAGNIKYAHSMEITGTYNGDVQIFLRA